MKVSRLLIVAALTASCSHEATSDGSDYKANEPAPAVSTTGEATTPTPAPPSAEIRAAKLATTPIADEARASAVNPNAAVIQDFKTLGKARAWASSNELKAALQKAGVTGTPQIWFTTRAGK